MQKYTVIYNRPVCNVYFASMMVIEKNDINAWKKKAVKRGMDIAFIFPGEHVDLNDDNGE